jgi:hypothetical protein
VFDGHLTVITGYNNTFVTILERNHAGMLCQTLGLVSKFGLNTHHTMLTRSLRHGMTYETPSLTVRRRVGACRNLDRWRILFEQLLSSIRVTSWKILIAWTWETLQ